MTDRWTPEEFLKWRPVAKYVICYGCAVFLVAYGSLNAVKLGLPLVGAMFALAVTCLGLPVALHKDSSRPEDDSQ